MIPRRHFRLASNTPAPEFPVTSLMMVGNLLLYQRGMISGDATVERGTFRSDHDHRLAGPRELFTELDAAHSQPYGKFLVINR